MEIDLTQSDDEEETSKEVGRRASYRPQQAAVPDLVASNSNLQSIDRMPTSLPPPLEPIDMRIPIKSKDECAANAVSIFNYAMQKLHNQQSNSIESLGRKTSPPPTHQRLCIKQFAGPFSNRISTHPAREAQQPYNQQHKISKEHRSNDCCKRPSKEADSSIKSPVVAPATALNSNVYCGICSFPPAVTDERDAVKSAFTPYRSTDRNNQINCFVPPAPASKPGAFYHKWKLPVATAPRAMTTVRESEIHVAHSVAQVDKNSSSPPPPPPLNLTVDQNKTATPNSSSPSGVSVIRRSSDLPTADETTSSSSNSSDSSVVVTAATNRPLNLSNYKPFLKLKKEHDGIRMKWSLPTTVDGRVDEVAAYELEIFSHTCDETGDGALTTIRENAWRKMGTLKALPLPMGCSLSKFTKGYRYHFRMRSILHGSTKDASPYSEPNSVVF